MIGTAQPLTARQKSVILLVASATSTLIMLDSNIVAVSLPSIARDLHAGFAGIQWVISAYLLTFAALLLPSGSLADLHGRRLTVMAGLGLFLISSAVCGLAPSVLLLEVARAVQGVGGSLLLTSALAIIASTFIGAERAKAYAFWGTCIGVAITMGPIVGGVITGLFGWRWAFLINIPLCVAFLAAIPFVVPESSDPHARGFDWFGVVTFSGALFASIWALIDGNELGWHSAPILERIAAAAVCFAGFIAVERMQARPMLDLSLFRNRMFLGAACGMAGYGASAQVMIFFLPVYLQGAFGFSPMIAGLAMLPFAAPLFLAPRIAAALLAGWSHRSALMLGLALTSGGTLLLALLAHSGIYAVAALTMLVSGIGTGILNPETAKSMQAQVPPQRAGMASGIGGTLRFTSLLFGVAVLGSVMAQFHPAFTHGIDASATRAIAAVALTASCIGLLALTGVGVLMAPPRAVAETVAPATA